MCISRVKLIGIPSFIPISRNSGLIPSQVIVSLLVWLAIPVYAKEISSASELGPFQFHSYINSDEVVGANRSDQGGFSTAVEIVDPVINGVQVPGFISTDAKMTADGPATWFTADLRLLGGQQFINIALIEAVSEVRYELAALGPAGQASVRISARGKKETTGSLIGSLFRARATARAEIKLYETDAQGNRGKILQTWLPERPSFAPGIDPATITGDEIPFDQINDTFTINTNQVYEVVVTSASNLEFRDTDAFNLDAYAYMESGFSSATPGVELVVSTFSESDVSQVSPPVKTTVSTSGADTAAVISAGTRKIGSSNYANNFQVGDAIEIMATIEPLSETIGQLASVYVVVVVGEQSFQLTSNGSMSFDGSQESLLALTESRLRAVTEINISELLGGQLLLAASDVGRYEIFVGYATEDSAIVFTADPTVIVISN